jgi:hypothetical protein
LQELLVFQEPLVPPDLKETPDLLVSAVALEVPDPLDSTEPLVPLVLPVKMDSTELLVLPVKTDSAEPPDFLAQLVLLADLVPLVKMAVPVTPDPLDLLADLVPLVPLDPKDPKE